ncbi:hypothetical protein B484DRAFT_458317 [Ochromonadaceae sp. CCMP2298]|nr:hypothetical protein B484DRAFT_458317 [Ochromonadaceae sp. CCMP2298]
MFTKFPQGRGPAGFKSNLQRLVVDIKELATTLGCSCRIFLPNIPLTALQSDPAFSLRVWPLGYFAGFLAALWDNQKVEVAKEDAEVGGGVGGLGKQGNTYITSHRTPVAPPTPYSHINTHIHINIYIHLHTPTYTPTHSLPHIPHLISPLIPPSPPSPALCTSALQT